MAPLLGPLNRGLALSNKRVHNLQALLCTSGHGIAESYSLVCFVLALLLSLSLF